MWLFFSSCLLYYLDINHLKSVYHSYEDKLCDFNRAIIKIDKFERDNYIHVSISYEEYASGEIRRPRLIISCMAKFSIFLTMIRFYLWIFFRNSPSKIYLMDYSEWWGDRVLVSLCHGTVILNMLAIGITVIYQELTHTEYYRKLFHLINTGQIKYPLRPMNFRKLARKVNLITDFIFKEFFIFMVLFCVFIHFGLTLKLLVIHEFEIFLIMLFIIYNIIVVNHGYGLAKP